MSVIWRKVWRDLAHNKSRTTLVVLSTAVGVFALGLVFGLSEVMRIRMTEDYRATLPAHITFWGGPFDQTVVDAVLREPGVVDVEGETYTTFRWKLNGETDWRDGNLVARADYDAQRVNLIDLLDGHWPAERTLALERQSSRYFGIPPGMTVLVESGRHERSLPVEGIVRVLTIFPPQFGGDATFYATPETVTWLNGFDAFNQLNVRLKSFSEESASEIAKKIELRLQRIGAPVEGYWITDPDVHWLQEQVDTVFVILAVLGALSLGLSAFLIVNTMNALISQQVWQIGVMKVIGATFGQVVRVYLMAALVYGTFASLVAVPLGAVGAYLMGGWLLGLINIDGGAFHITPVAVGVQVTVGLTVPVLAALVPAIGGARITPHQAISNYGLGGGFGRGRLDRLIGHIRRLPRSLSLSLRNMFRRKVRVVLTLLTLVLAGAMFIAVMSVGSSLNNTLEVLLGDFGFDTLVGLGRLYRVMHLVEVVESVPGVVKAEVWDRRRAMLSLVGGGEREIYLWGLPPDSAMFNPRILSGRGLLPQDGRAILLNDKIAAEKSIRVGDQIELSIDGRKSTWTVVGLILNINNDQRDNFVPFNALARETGNVNRGTIVMVTSEQHSAEGQRVLIQNLRDAFAARRIEATFFQSADEVRKQNRTQFDLITYLMLSMAILAAIVSGFGLMGTMSLNVVERGREIGVMRAIGAASDAIVRVFVGEGVLLSVLSWLLAVPLSYPLARAFSVVIGSALMRVPLDFSYSLDGVVLWLLIVVVLSSLASLWPALAAAKISVREALAYE